MVLAGGGKRGVRGLTQPLGSQTAESGEQGALAVSCSEPAPPAKTSKLETWMEMSSKLTSPAQPGE